jgi:hypothetical protein
MDKPIHVIVRDARVGRDRSTDTDDGAEILWEYDTDDLRYPNDGDVISSPSGETFKVLGLRSAFRNHHEVLTLFATDNL